MNEQYRTVREPHVHVEYMERLFNLTDQVEEILEFDLDYIEKYKSLLESHGYRVHITQIKLNEQEVKLYIFKGTPND